MRFTEGLWQDRCGMKLHRAQNLWRCSAGNGQIKAMVPCRQIHSVADTISGPVLHFTFSSPREDMISVRISHFTGGMEKGPYFSLSLEEPEVLVEEDEKSVTMTSGKLMVVINKTGLFGFTFYYDGVFLTTSGSQSTAYVTDAEYEADLANDYNGRPAQPYMKETYIREQLSLDVGEYIYGLGEHFTPFVKNGQTVDVWNRDGGSCSDQGYKNIPFYLSSKGYGVLVNTPDRVEYEIGNASVRHVEFSVEGESMEYIIIGSNEPKAALSKYTALAGRTPVPPAWSFGLWLSTSWMPDSNEKITMDFIDGMNQRGIPLSVFHFDARWMDDYNLCDFLWTERFGDATAMLKRIHDKGIKVCVWINPYISQESRLFEEGKRNGYFIKKQDGSVWQTDSWMSGIGIVDFTNPAACAWYAGYLEALVDMGVDCFKTDFGERIPTNVQYFDGSDPVKMHNYYPYLYNRTVFEMLERKKGKGEACVFSRSATVGTQQFPVNWGGDNDASYVSMAESLRGGLSFCQSGFGFWSHDISGFVGTATPDLYKRWTAFGLLSTHSRLHGMESYRVPWCFDEESSLVLARFTRLKCSLMPYIFSGAVRVNRTGEPEMRAMMLEFPQDPTCLQLDRQYMLGENLLVAPVFREDGIVDFYVPEGLWTNYLDNERFVGGKWYKRKYDYFNLPLLVRPGSIIAKGGKDGSAVYDYADGITYRVYELDEGSQSTCRIYSSSCEEVLCATARREDGRIYFLVTGSDSGKDWSLQLCGIAAVQRVTGGSAAPCEEGILIHPDKGVLSLEVLL